MRFLTSISGFRSYSDPFETRQALYRLFRTNHWRVTEGAILGPERIAELDGIGAGHKRIPGLIQNRKLRDAILRKYEADDYDAFDDRYLQVFFKFSYNPAGRVWEKKKYDIDLFKTKVRKPGIMVKG